jgi:hypothetical protein
MSAERPRFGSTIGFSIGSLEITALVLAVVGAAIAWSTVNMTGFGVILLGPLVEAALPPIVHRFAPGSAHIVRLLACVMMLTFIGLSPSEVGYLFIPAAAVMVVVAWWSGRKRREALRQALLAAQRRQRRGGQKGRRKRSSKT